MPNIIPVILLKKLIILPNQEIKIELNNKLSKLVIKKAMTDYNNEVLVVSPLDQMEEEPSTDDLPKVGVIAKIKSKIELNNNNIRLNLKGIKRVVINKYFPSKWNKDILSCEYEEIELPKFAPLEEKALQRKLINTLKDYISSSDNISNSILTTVNKAKNLNSITDIITSFLPFDFEKKCYYMQNYNPLNRAKDLVTDLLEELEIIKLDNEIDEIVQENLEENQKEFILREKIKAIKNELGEKSSQEITKDKFLAKLNSLKINPSTYNKILNEINKLTIISETSPELGVLINYLDWILSLPWNKTSKDCIDAREIMNKLNESHFGLKEIKNLVSDFALIKQKNKKIKAPIICLVGPPGVGKTSIAIAISKVLNRQFYKISVGGLNDSTELIGNRRTYLGANPGKIIQGLRKCGTKNPVILIDEVDKMMKNYHGDPASTLLEIIDPMQNAFFTDNYIEEPFDLSDVFFILTANDILNIPLTILDRVLVININSYTIFDKIEIANNYILPKLFKKYGINKIAFSIEVLKKIINEYTYEAGCRELERILEILIRKAIINNKAKILENDLKKYLGLPKYSLNNFENLNSYGIVNLLGVNTCGGTLEKVETAITDGDGKITITGSVGKVLEESIYVVLTYLKNKYKIVLDKKNIHVHFLESNFRKDGPSAGVAITTAILSFWKRKPIKANIAFTGEISLNGSILPVGGLKEKIIAAYNNGVNIVYIPIANINILEEIPKLIKENMEIIPIKNYEEIYAKYFK